MVSNNHNTPRTQNSQVNSIEKLLLHFDHVKPIKDNQWMARCPAHKDDKASLSITTTPEKALIHCFAGCDIETILKTASLDIGDLFFTDRQKPTAIYQYRNADGSLSHEKLRYKTPDGKRFTQRQVKDGSIVDDLKDVQRIPYNYPNVVKAIKEGSPILYVEGEKDANTGKILGYYSSTTMGGASDWKPEYAQYFKGAKLIIIPDKDDAGLKVAYKLIDSLKTTAKSIRVLILPEGKDLTEWVEAGNHDLQPLIDTSSVELSENAGIPEPIMTTTINGYKFFWIALNLEIRVDHIVNDNDSEITVLDNGNPIYMSGFKLLSISHRAELNRELKKLKKIDWDRISNQVATKTLAELRKGESVIWLNDLYGATRPEFLIEPLFIKGAPNIIYADQSGAKSLLVTLFDLLLFFPSHANNGLGLHCGKQSYALFADWENNEHITGHTRTRLMRGLGEDITIPFPYLPCRYPLHKMVEHLSRKIQETGATTLIIDSLGLAVGGDLNATEPALNFFAALRQLPVTPIIIAHTSKDITNKRKTIYGNAYYQNESRMIWEVVKQQQENSNVLTTTLFNRKPAPFLPLHPPLAYQFTFDNDKIEVEATDPISDNRTNPEDMSDSEKVMATLETENRPLWPADIQKILVNIEPGTVRSALSRFTKSGKVTRREDGSYLFNGGGSNG